MSITTNSECCGQYGHVAHECEDDFLAPAWCRNSRHISCKYDPGHDDNICDQQQLTDQHGEVIHEVIYRFDFSKLTKNSWHINLPFRGMFVTLTPRFEPGLCVMNIPS